MANETIPIESPCVQICQLDKNNMCIGCHRSLREIARWPEMTDAEKKDISLRISRQIQSKESES